MDDLGRRDHRFERGDRRALLGRRLLGGTRSVTIRSDDGGAMVTLWSPFAGRSVHASASAGPRHCVRTRPSALASTGPDIRPGSHARGPWFDPRCAHSGKPAIQGFPTSRSGTVFPRRTPRQKSGEPLIPPSCCVRRAFGRPCRCAALSPCPWRSTPARRAGPAKPPFPASDWRYRPVTRSTRR